MIWGNTLIIDKTAINTLKYSTVGVIGEAEILESILIQLSLSMKGFPYDNAVVEPTFRMIKMEFAAGKQVSTVA